MHLPRLIVPLLIFCVPMAAHAEDFVTRRDGFLMIWQSVLRPAEEVRETPYADVPEGSTGHVEITYGKARGLLRDHTHFYPDESLSHGDALLMLFRTRNVEPFSEPGIRKLMEIAEAEDIPLLASHYGLPEKEGAVTREELLDLQQRLDAALVNEEHEASLYSEKFHGKGTAFGETFDMHAMTAAHRTYPQNTMVRVTNIANGKSVTVRINDRGPFVQGRDMDLSLAAFLAIEERSKGVIMARFERLGDSGLIEDSEESDDSDETSGSPCTDTRYQRRIVRDTVLHPGIPHRFTLGETLRLSSEDDFVVRDVIYPSKERYGMQTWLTDGEAYEFRPTEIGEYIFLMGNGEGRMREMRMRVRTCDV